MQVFKCKICAGSVILDRDNGIAICEYCGSRQALPQFTDDSSKRLYDSGNNYLQNSEYDKAENVFNQLLAINPKDPEIYWSLALCKYGVTFVVDSQTEKYIPTCNRTHYDSILKDKNYLNALKYANKEKGDFYKEQAQIIDNIQRGIINISKKEKPFDIFISYKESDENGKRTPESIKAQNLYNRLTAEGYKVFFSRITLEDKVGTEFEPYIFAALSSSKVMLTITSSKKNIESAWVKNEWSRYLITMRGNSQKNLIPIYFDMDKQDLPDEFSMFSAINMDAEDFEQELLRGLSKLLKKTKDTSSKSFKFVIGSIIVVAVCTFSLITIISSNRKENSNTNQQTQEQEQSSVNIDSLDEKEKQESYNIAMKFYNEEQYAKASWQFQKLGDYNDSLAMLEKANLSWRKLLATPIAEDYDRYKEGVYFVNKNGQVSSFNENAGSAANELDILKHGKIVSITSAEKLYALHEDGYVSNALVNNNLKNEWMNIIKISPIMRSTNIALKSDGTMLYGTTVEEEKWIEAVGEWNEIVDFTFSVSSSDIMKPTGAIIGVKADGTICGVVKIQDFGGWNTGYEHVKEQEKAKEFEENGFFEILQLFSSISIKKIDCSLYYDMENDKFSMDVVALTTDNRLVTYLNGKFTNNSQTDIIDIISTNIVLKSNGDVYDIYSNKVLYHDVVYGWCGKSLKFVTKTGSVIDIQYYLSGDYGDVTVTDEKIKVFDEWIKRLK